MPRPSRNDGVSTSHLSTDYALPRPALRAVGTAMSYSGHHRHRGRAISSSLAPMTRSRLASPASPGQAPPENRDPIGHSAPLGRAAMAHAWAAVRPHVTVASQSATASRSDVDGVLGGGQRASKCFQARILECLPECRKGLDGRGFQRPPGSRRWSTGPNSFKMSAGNSNGAGSLSPVN